MGVEPHRILITGASGFVGRHLMPLLTATFRNAAILAPEIDLRDSDQVDAMVEDGRPDVCVHLAAVAAVTEAQRDQDRAWELNLHGTLHLARAILRHVPQCLFLHASSADAYGSSFQSGLRLKENAPLAPMSVYSATKAAADLALGSMVFQGLHVVRLRPVNHIGPGQSPLFAVAAFSRQIARIAIGLQAPVMEVGNLDAQRDFLDVRDVCAAYVACIEHRDELTSGTILNVASGTSRRMADVLGDLQRLAGVQVEVRIDKGKLRKEDLPLACADATRAQELLGWAPRVPWERTLKEVLEYWLHEVTLPDGRC